MHMDRIRSVLLVDYIYCREHKQMSSGSMGYPEHRLASNCSHYKVDMGMELLYIRSYNQGHRFHNKAMSLCKEIEN